MSETEDDDNIIFNQSSGFLTEQEKKQAYELARNFWESPDGLKSIKESRLKQQRKENETTNNTPLLS